MTNVRTHDAPLPQAGETGPTASGLQLTDLPVSGAQATGPVIDTTPDPVRRDAPMPGRPTHVSTGQERDETRFPPPAVQTVRSLRVSCDGDESLGLGHPRVWLAISPQTGFVDCGYCDKRFALDPAGAQDAH